MVTRPYFASRDTEQGAFSLKYSLAAMPDAALTTSAKSVDRSQGAVDFPYTPQCLLGIQYTYGALLSRSYDDKLLWHPVQVGHLYDSWTVARGQLRPTQRRTQRRRCASLHVKSGSLACYRMTMEERYTTMKLVAQKFTPTVKRPGTGGCPGQLTHLYLTF